MEPVLAALHELVAIARGQRTDGWVGLKSVAAHLDMSYDYVEKKIVTQPTFPLPARVNGTGHPRWRLSEVDRWMQTQQA